MSISIPKTKAQHIRQKPAVSETTEADIANLPEDEAFKFICDKCDRAFPKQTSLNIHKGRHCKGRRTRKQASRKGTLADKVIQMRKVKQKYKALPQVMIGNELLDNVYSFVYLGAEIAGNFELA